MAKSHNLNKPPKVRTRPEVKAGRVGIIDSQNWLLRDSPDRVLDGPGGRARADAPTSAVTAARRELRALRRG